MKAQDLKCPDCGRDKHPASPKCELCITTDKANAKIVQPLHKSIGTTYRDRLKTAGIRSAVAENFLANDKLKPALQSLLEYVNVLERQKSELYTIIEELEYDIEQLAQLVRKMG